MASGPGIPVTHSRPVDISQSSDAAPGLDEVRNFVGSPEDLSVYQAHLASSNLFDLTDNIDESSHDTTDSTLHAASRSSSERLRLYRSVTLPSTTISDRVPSSFLQGSTRRPRRLSYRDRERPPHEWTVFGELMGSEDSTGATVRTASARELGRRSIRDLLSMSFSGSGSHRASISSQVTPILSPMLPVEARTTSPGPDPHVLISSMHQAAASQDRYPAPPSPHHRTRTNSSSSSDDTVTVKARSATTPKPWFRIPELPLLYRNILKCSIAYFLGSLFTFCPYLSGFIVGLSGSGPGDRTPSPSGHMVATIAVYFNPAKTFGGMLEADAFCGVGLIFAAFVSLSSMSIYWFFEVRHGWEWLADTLAILLVGMGMSTIAWMKMWMNKPTFNTACSMTSIILFIVVVKEGGFETLLQVALIVFVGSTISNFVCYTLWPQRATHNLQATMTKTLDSFSTLLTMITETFLLEEPLLLVSQEKLQTATANHQNSFTALKKNLSEAQSERFWGGPGRVTATTLLEESTSRQHLGRAYEDAIDSLNRLGQHLNGLRSGISVQFELVKASRGGKLTLRRAPSKSALSAIEEEPNGKGKACAHGTDCHSEEEDALLQAAADAFGEIVDDLGPPLKSLSTTCTDTLKRLREAFNDTSPGGDQDLKPEEFHEMADALSRALFTFESTSNHAVVRLYRRGNGSASESIASLSEESPVPSGSESETIFLVYFFFFTLQEFSRELVCLVDAMSRICEIQHQNSLKRSLKELLAVPWKWLRSKYILRRGRKLRYRTRSNTLSKRFSHFFLPEPAHGSVSFPKVTPHAPNTKQTPAREELSFTGKINQSLWALGAWMKQSDIKYCFKVGMATAMLAAPAFFDTTRPIFVEYRGEWALISFFVVISPTIGGTNFMALHRVLGTLLGAATAVAIWTAFPENPYVLAIFGFFFSMPCFYYIVSKPQYATSGRFVLLTYNLTCLYSYNLRQHDISIITIAYHRAAAVIVGVIWAALVSRYWWPIEARRELSIALGEFCLNLGWLYTRLVAFNSFDGDRGLATVESIAEHANETTALLQSTPSTMNESIMEFMAMELHLQIKLIELQGLLAQTQNEPRLKGPFPVKLYRSMLTSLQTTLDKLHSMRCVTSREEWHTTVRQDFIIPTNKQRREMVGNVILYFSVLAAAFRLKAPLPPYLPPAKVANERLVDAIRQLDVVKTRDVKGSRQLLFFAYALTMQGVIRELDYLGRTLQDTFGVIGESTEAFEALFRDTMHETV